MLLKSFFPVSVVVAIMLIFFLVSKKTSNQSQSTPIPLASQTNEEGQVQVRITPINVTKKSSIWEFEIVLDTHTVELDYDLTKMTVLIDEQGREYKPVSRTGPVPDGHHLQGSLIFEGIKQTTEKIEIKVLNVGGIPVRSFKWGLD